MENNPFFVLFLVVLIGFIGNAFCWVDDYPCGIPPAFGSSSNRQKRHGGYDDRIINGIDVPLGHHPWIVKILYPTSSSCTGTIISNNFVITAKHCILPYLKPTHILYGHVEVHEMHRIGIKSIQYIGELSSRDEGVDIALIELAEPLTYSDTVAPICLSRLGDLTEFDRGFIAGFGYEIAKIYKPRLNAEQGDFVQLSKNNIIGKPVNVVKYNVIDRMVDKECTCNCPNNSTDIKRESEMCAGGLNTGTMLGDSGGPLMIMRGDRWVLSGITSRGRIYLNRHDKSTIYDKGIYTKVSRFCYFIEETTKGQAKCRDY